MYQTFFVLYFMQNGMTKDNLNLENSTAYVAQLLM